MAENQGDAPTNEPVEPARRRGAGRPWPPGVSGNPKGRPRGYDLKALAEEHRLVEGEPAAVTMARVLRVIAAAALGGDMGAAKLLLDRLGLKEADEVLLTDDRADMPEEEFARRVVSLLAILQARKAAVRN